MLLGQAVVLEALEALEALVLLLSRTLGLIILVLALVLSSAQHYRAAKELFLAALQSRKLLHGYDLHADLSQLLRG